MADARACAGRVERLRELMAERGYDAVILRNNPDLRWLTGSERTFDDEVAHTAFVTADGLWLHTDSRYYNTFVTRLGEDCYRAAVNHMNLAPETCVLVLSGDDSDLVLPPGVSRTIPASAFDAEK